MTVPFFVGQRTDEQPHLVNHTHEDGAVHGYAVWQFGGGEYIYAIAQTPDVKNNGLANYNYMVLKGGTEPPVGYENYVKVAYRTANGVGYDIYEGPTKPYPKR